MKLDVVRTQFGKDATNGLLFIDGKFECYTLEDEYRTVKVMHETCIPEGTYPIEFRTVGGFDAKYTKRYGADFHKGMLWIRGVPEFEYILIHTGNTDSHTSVCLLVGETQQDLDKGKDGFVGGSGDAYKKMYPKVRDALLNGEQVEIKYSKINLDSSETKVYQTKPNHIEEKISDISGKLEILIAKMEGKNII